MTLFEFIQRAMPRGTLVLGPQEAPSWDQPPDWPPNLFAVAALLIEKLDLLARWDPADADQQPAIAAAVAVGRAWLNVDWSDGAADPDLPLDPVQQAHKDCLAGWWRTLLSEHGELRLTERGLGQAEQNGLLRLLILRLVQLLAVADEASEWVGYPFSLNETRDGVTPWRWVQGLLALEATRQAKKRLSRGRGAQDRVRGLTTLTLRFAPELGSVLPKARTPSVGCTLRALSHNLALLPPDTQVRTLWSYEPSLAEDLSGYRGGFNLLIVPFPYRIAAADFRPSRMVPGRRAAFFEMQQNWLPQGARAATVFADWLEELILAAEREGPVHAVVFPELALSAELYAAAAARIEQLCYPPAAAKSARAEARPGPRIELFVAGVCGPRSNRVETRIYYPGAGGTTTPVSASQGKHHRWKLDRPQLTRYGLSGVLHAADDYWEELNIGRREVYFHPFREGSVLCCLICEDLARLDPCQPVVRAIGPNLLIALLMDGPQLTHRWPARYATVLAEDPGSAVLTVSSLGLTRLSERLGCQPPNRSVALWKSPGQDARTLELPDGHEALLACLHPRCYEETSLDGRDDDGTAVQWQLEAVLPIRSGRPAGDWPHA